MYAKGYFLKSPVVVSFGQTLIVCASSYPADVRDASFVVVEPKINAKALCNNNVVMKFGAGIEGVNVSGGIFVNVSNAISASSVHTVPTIVNVRSIGCLQLLEIENNSTSGNVEIEYVKWGKEWND